MEAPKDWRTPEYEFARKFVTESIWHGSTIEVVGLSGCGEMTASTEAELEQFARQCNGDALFAHLTPNGKVRLPIRVNEHGRLMTPAEIAAEVRQAERRALEPEWSKDATGKRAQSDNGQLVRPRTAGCVTRCMDNVTACEVRWLWEGYVPLGKVTIIVGDPGLGKSYASMDMAARASNGFGWPTEKLEPGEGYEECSVVILNAEDDLADTVRPRLDSLEANCCNIHAIEGVRRTADADQAAHLSLALDLPLLEETIIDKRARLVIIDPLSAYLGSVDSHKDAEVRSILSPLRDLAERQGVAVVGIMHLNKSTGTNAMQRAIGSVAFGAAARMMWLIAVDPDDDHRRLFLPMKSNLKGQGSGLAFTITEDGKIAWDSTPLDKGANQVLAELAEQGRGTQGREAADFLRDALAAGSMDSKEVLSLAKKEGIAEKTLRRTKKKIGVKSVQDGYGGGWLWELPTTSTTAATA